MAFGFVGNAHKWREQVNIHCEGTDFVMENMRAFRIKDGNYSQVPTDIPDETADEAFVRLVRGHGENWAPPEDVWPIVTFTAAGLESAAAGREVAVTAQSDQQQALQS
jgi:predicted dehydrogenase